VHWSCFRKPNDWKRRQGHGGGKRLHERRKKRGNARKKKRKRNGNLKRNVDEKMRNDEGWFQYLQLVIRKIIRQFH
jgi:hypothetical protein